MRALGELYTRRGDFVRAETLLGAAVERCKRRRDTYQLGLALLEFGALCLDRADAEPERTAQRRAQAHFALAEAARNFAALGAQHDLGRVTQLLHLAV